MHGTAPSKEKGCLRGESRDKNERQRDREKRTGVFESSKLFARLLYLCRVVVYAGCVWAGHSFPHLHSRLCVAPNLGPRPGIPNVACMVYPGSVHSCLECTQECTELEAGVRPSPAAPYTRRSGFLDEDPSSELRTSPTRLCPKSRQIDHVLRACPSLPPIRAKSIVSACASIAFLRITHSCWCCPFQRLR